MRQVSATELAKLGKCERQAYFDYHYGEDKSLTAAYITRGNREHEKFNHQLSGSDRRCFIATAVFGADAVETDILRRFRDERLLPYSAGRAFVTIYYRVSPSIAAFIRCYPTLVVPIRQVLLCFIKFWRNK